MIQREREMEGDEFKDKEAFVTQAYKDQMEEVRKAEEEEKQREEEEKNKNKGQSTGMVHFYRQLLEQSEKEHEETVAAVSAEKTQKVAGPTMPNLTISKPADYVPKSDLELAKLASAEGKNVELNDDNQIVDKRELLSAGLNLSLPNTRRLGLNASTSRKKDINPGEMQVHTAVGTAASRREIDERRRREVLKQMEEEQERVAQEKEQREKEAVARIVAKRNTEDDVQSARERYLARKRRKLEERNTAQDMPPDGA